MISRLGLDKAVRLLAALGVTLVIALGALVIGVVAVHSNSETSRELRGSCYFSRVVAEAPIPAAVTELGLRFVAGARAWYETVDCPDGPLPPPDPRVRRYLPRGAR